MLASLPLSLTINLTNSLSGVPMHMRKGNIQWGDVTRLFVATLPGIALGIMTALWLSADALRAAFALFFVFIGSRMFRQGLRK